MQPGDTRRPTVKALDAVKAHPDQWTIIRHRVHDPSPSCDHADVPMVIKPPDGSGAWSTRLDDVPTNERDPLLRLPLPTGLYHYYVNCSAAAGNAGRRTPANSHGFPVY